MTTIPHHSNWVDGAYQAASPEKIIVRNPATEIPLATIDSTSLPCVTALISSSLGNFHGGKWSKASAQERFSVLSTAANLLRARLPEFVLLESQQTGRPIREMKAQLSRVPEWLDYFASLARTSEGSVTPFKGPIINTLTRLPLGVVIQITPWNHPLLIAMKKLAAALAAGNSVILKPSEAAPLSVLAMGKIFQDAGLPDGTLQICSGYGHETGRFLCESKDISKIDLTGGLTTYEAVAPVAARNLIPITAELGGKAPVCFFPSLPVEQGVRAALFAAFVASGQTCVTGSRLLIHTDIYDAFVSLLLKRTRNLRLGDPLDERTQIGALISSASVDRCADAVARAVQEGGRLLCGGEATTVHGRGFFFQTTLIETQSDSHLVRSEVFGPVIAIIRCASEDEIVRVANATSFALGASVWTADFSQAHRVAGLIEAGIVWINGHHLNDPSSPWGGFRESGLGKENGVAAYESYTRLKSTVINYGEEPSWFDDQAYGVDGLARYG